MTRDSGLGTLDWQSFVRLAPWREMQFWHESQKFSKRPDGSLEMTFRVGGLDEIKRWVLSFGPECRVLEPEKLRKLLQQDLHRNLAQYSKPPLSFSLMKQVRVV